MVHKHKVFQNASATTALHFSLCFTAQFLKFTLLQTTISDQALRIPSL